MGLNLKPGWRLIDHERRSKLRPRVWKRVHRQHLDCLKIGDSVKIAVENQRAWTEKYRDGEPYWCSIVSTAGQTMQVYVDCCCVEAPQSGLKPGDGLDIDYRHIIDFDEVRHQAP